MDAKTQDFDLLQLARARAKQQAVIIEQLRHECFVLALGLYHVRPTDVAAETARVMDLWRRRVEDELGIAEPALCSACAGSGEGLHDGTKCSACHGWAIERERVTT